jgi:hypothetical protein
MNISFGSGISDFVDLLDTFNRLDVFNIFGALKFNFVIFVIIALAGTALFYMLTRYATLSIGAKAGLVDDWMPFVPVANTIYKLKLIDEPWWKLFFFGSPGMVISLILGWILFLIFHLANYSAGFIIGTIAIVAIQGLGIYHTVYFGFERYKVFGFNQRLNFALTFFVLFRLLGGMLYSIWFLLALGATSLLSGATAFGMLIVFIITSAFYGNPTIWLVDWIMAYHPKIVYGDEENSDEIWTDKTTGKITGVSGVYAGQSFKIKNGEEMIFGRDGSFAHIVISGSSDKVSRKHCVIRYDAGNRAYYVTDFSSNGTSYNGGVRLVANIPTQLPLGTVISLGDNANQFRLG